MILRLSKSTTDFLSCYIDFGSESNIKMMVLDKNISFVRFYIEIVVAAVAAGDGGGGAEASY